MIKVSDADAKKLTDTIVEAEASRELYEAAIKRVDCVPEALKVILDYYMHALKVHKALWREILVQYMGEDEATRLYKILRFDTVKKVIFQLDIKGCALCKSN
jgi:hypothetical protein